MKTWLLFVRMRYLYVALFLSAMVPGTLWALLAHGAPSTGWFAAIMSGEIALALLFCLWTVEHMVRCRALFTERLTTYLVHEAQKIGRLPDAHIMAAILFIRRYPFASNEAVFKLSPAPDIKPNQGEPEGTKYARLEFQLGDLRIRFCEKHDPEDRMLFNMHSMDHKDIHYVMAADPLKGRVLSRLKTVCK